MIQPSGWEPVYDDHYNDHTEFTTVYSDGVLASISGNIFTLEEINRVNDIEQRMRSGNARELLITKSDSMRCRVFCRLLHTFKANRDKDLDYGKITFKYLVGESKIHIPKTPNLPISLMAACYHSPEVREVLSSIKLYSDKIERPILGVDPELIEPLQDLAFIFADEIDSAFKDEDYWGVDEEYVPDDHVITIMEALQREATRERRRNRDGSPGTPVFFRGLPWQRQVALAERRAMWFRTYGVTPESYPYFNFWNISNAPLPNSPNLSAWAWQ